MQQSCKKLLIISFFLSIINITALEQIPYVDFDVSMQKELYPFPLKKPHYMISYLFFKNLYEMNNPNNIEPQKELKIPKKIHQIWLGPPMPEEFKIYQQSWIEKHPDWEYKLWTEKDIATFDFFNKDLFDAATNYAEKSDIWRYEILFQEGGVYVDMDFECLQSLDPLNYTYDFFIGIQHLDTNKVQLGIGLIGTIPGHPILGLCVKQIRVNKNIRQIIVKTGPQFFTQCFCKRAGQTEFIDIAFPASYFYPCGYEQRGKSIEVWYQPEAFAVHHWAGSWLKPEAFAYHTQSQTISVRPIDFASLKSIGTLRRMN